MSAHDLVLEDISFFLPVFAPVYHCSWRGAGVH